MGEMTVEAVAEVVVAAVTVEAMTIEIEAMVVAAEVTVVAVEAAADRPLLSIVLDGSTAHVHVLTHHVAIDSCLLSGPMNFCKKSERTVESASVSISVYQNFGSCSELIRDFGSSQTI